MSPSLAVGQRYVLVVENDPALRASFRDALRAAGFDPVAVEDGLSALRCVEAAKPRAVVLDLDLPRGGGFDVQQELSAHPDTKHIPIVVLGGGDRSRLSRSDVILRKPVSADDLIAVVQRCLRPPTSTGGLPMVAVVAVAKFVAFRAVRTQLRFQRLLQRWSETRLRAHVGVVVGPTIGAE